MTIFWFIVFDIGPRKSPSIDDFKSTAGVVVEIGNCLMASWNHACNSSHFAQQINQKDCLSNYSHGVLFFRFQFGDEKERSLDLSALVLQVMFSQARQKAGGGQLKNRPEETSQRWTSKRWRWKLSSTCFVFFPHRIMALQNIQGFWGSTFTAGPHWALVFKVPSFLFGLWPQSSPGRKLRRVGAWAHNGSRGETPTGFQCCLSPPQSVVVTPNSEREREREGGRAFGTLLSIEEREGRREHGGLQGEKNTSRALWRRRKGGRGEGGTCGFL